MISILCAQCGDSFETSRSTAVYCSRRCKEKARLLRRNTLTCRVCSKPMVPGPNSLPQGQAAHRECLGLAPKGVLRCGTPYSYRKGCRCRPCTDAKNLKMQLSGYNSWISPRTRLEIYERDKWTCRLCGKLLSVTGPHRPSLDHIQPRSLGGSDAVENLRAAGWACNARRGAPEDWKPRAGADLGA